MKGGQAGTPVGGSGQVGSDAPAISPELIETARADDTEGTCAEHEATIARLESELASANEALGVSERRREIERLLHQSDTLDLEAATLLTEAAVSEMSEPDVAIAVEELRRRKPFLFRAGEPAPPAPVGAAMSPAGEPSNGRAELGSMAEEARMSGDRRALLRYLRQRRGVG